jgi:decaprenylphospho-beta-D-erythro-pentofuranosid-2-ulose 2-reductase
MIEKTFGKGCRVLILGATSGIAQSLAREFARHGFELVLAGRDREELEILAADVRVRYGAKSQILEFSATDFDSHPNFWQSCGALDGVVCCFGVMYSQSEAERDWEKTRAMIDVNYTACVSILNLAANEFEERKRGFIGIVTSIAGERGQRRNYLYGSTKSAASTYAEGLRSRLWKAGVSVTDIKPGPVDTAMTFGLDKLPLLVGPEKVASDIYRGLRRKADVVYTPAPWRFIMAILCAVPAWLWKRVGL